ncbi:hypothetical protein CBR64_12580 [Cellulosimicrobium cellulans]|jgi:hypothetical protein|uniref:Uncharacterized protein n=1 Tax=Cellulosimicrobium cellulans TaxID=1710 RepID=A0A1Y0HVJ7_CELCE|nr:hypothetical protein [Cellulosimicrobium cellulans]ARU52171.1 hypothetical protein CBR64_12580 [Cellulosimicrobium cellulans]
MDENIAQHMRDRPAERVWLVWDAAPQRDFDGVALAAGLRPLGDYWIEIDADRAEQVLAHVLRTGLAYSDEHMPEHRARRLAREFIRSCGTDETRYATNTKGLPGNHLASWMPATDYTIDGGIVILGTSRSACYWVADED